MTAYYPGSDAAADPAPSRDRADRAAARAAHRRTAIGAALLLLAVIVWVARVFLDVGVGHSWNPDADPPRTVHLTAGHQYAISTRGGPGGLIADQVSTQPQVTCSASGASGTTDVPVTVDVSDERITHQIATFVSPVTGQVAVRCSGTGAVFVDDADDAAFDLGTGLVVVCSVLALFGVAFLMSGLTGRAGRERPAEQPGVAAHAGPA